MSVSMGSGVRFTGPWKKWLRSLDPKAFERRLKIEIRKATLKNCLLVVREIRKAIQGGDYAPNSMMQLAAKYPKSKPLVDSGDLFGAVTHLVINEFSAFVGIQRTAKGKDGEDLVNIAAALHDGFEQEVTPAMRRAAFARIREQNPEGADWLEDSLPRGEPARTVWVWPPRPFIEDVIGRADVQVEIRRNWSAAVERSLFGA